jgi:hypothetical protein
MPAPEIEVFLLLFLQKKKTIFLPVAPQHDYGVM